VVFGVNGSKEIKKYLVRVAGRGNDLLENGF